MSIVTLSVQDVFMDSLSPTVNENSNTHLYIGELNIGGSPENTRTLIKATDLDNPSTIPAGSTINSAKIRLWLLTDYSSNARTCSVRRLKRAWVDSQGTYNEYSTGNSWQTAGGGGVNDRETTPVGTRAMSDSETTGAFLEFTLDAASVQEMISGGSWTNNGWIMEVDTESDDCYEYASTAHATAAFHPEVVVDFTPPITQMEAIFFRNPASIQQLKFYKTKLGNI